MQEFILLKYCLGLNECDATLRNDTIFRYESMDTVYKYLIFWMKHLKWEEIDKLN